MSNGTLFGLSTSAQVDPEKFASGNRSAPEMGALAGVIVGPCRDAACERVVPDEITSHAARAALATTSARTAIDATFLRRVLVAQWNPRLNFKLLSLM
jgi:hypothetical protein